jgi:hypothetical protein
MSKLSSTEVSSPFNSQDFTNFAEEMGFIHKKVTPRHPKAQGQVENFNKLINKTVKIAHNAGSREMLQAYISAPHPATNKTPYELLMNRMVRTTLDHHPTEQHENDEEVRKKDSIYKQRLKDYNDKRHLKQENTNSR